MAESVRLLWLPMKKIILLTILVSGTSMAAPSSKWTYSTNFSSQNSMLQIKRGETCKQVKESMTPVAIKSECQAYKQGSICGAGESDKQVTVTFDSKSACQKGLRKAKRNLVVIR